jgi:hypothetical protein
LMSKKMMSVLLTLLFICLTFFGLPWTGHTIQTSVWGSCYILPERLSNHCQGFRLTFSWTSTKSDAQSLFLCRYHREVASGQIQGSK